MKPVTTTFAFFALALLAVALLAQSRLHSRATRAVQDAPPSGQFVTLADGARVHLQVMGAGPDLVLIHGANGNLRDFTLSLAPRLAERYRVIAVDRPALGHSDPLPDGEYALAAQASRLREAVGQLGVTNPILVGQSYGGSVAMAWALDAPPAALVLISAPTLPWPGELDPWYRITRSAIGRAVVVPLAAAFVPRSYLEDSLIHIFAPDPVPAGYGDHVGLGLSVRAASLGATVGQINSLRPQVVNMSEDYPRLNIPVELIHGDRDTIVPLDIHSRPLAALLPDAHLTVIEGGGHMPHHAHPDEVIAAINRAATRAGLR